MTFTDITALKQAEQAIQRGPRLCGEHRRNRAGAAAGTGLRLRVVSASAAYYRVFGGAPEETEGRPLTELNGGQWNLPV